MFASLALPSGLGFAQESPSPAVPGEEEEASTAEGEQGASAPRTEADTASPQPWAKGVSREDQAAALNSFRQGNDFFGQRQYSEALKHYKRALSHWKHPAIYFNTAVCQVNLDQPIEAKQNLEAALKYESAPLGEELYAQGLTYQKLLGDRLGHLTVKLRRKGAQVTLDGEELFVGPGEEARVLLPGKHQVVAELSGFLTYTRAVQVDPGKPTTVEVELVPLGEATEYERPMATWIPLAVMGGGALIGGIGWGMRAMADANIRRYDDFVTDNCPSGCQKDQVPEDRQKALRSGETLGVASVATMSVGGAVLVGGVTLLLLNGPRPVLSTEKHEVSWSPSFGPGRLAVDVGLSF